MVHSDDEQVATPLQIEETSSQKKKRGPTRMKYITRFSSEGRKIVIQYSELDQPIGPNATNLKSFIGTTVRFHVPFTYSIWHAIPKEMKEKIYELIEVKILLIECMYIKPPTSTDLILLMCFSHCRPASFLTISRRKAYFKMREYAIMDSSRD